VLITNKRVYFVRNREPDIENVILQVDYPELVAASVVNSHNRQAQVASNLNYGTNTFLELTMKSVRKCALIFFYACLLLGTQL